MPAPKTDSSNVIDWNSIRGGSTEEAINALTVAIGDRVKEIIFPVCAAAFYKNSQQGQRQSLTAQFGAVAATIFPLLGGGLRLELTMGDGEDDSDTPLLRYETGENTELSDYGIERRVPGTAAEFQFVRREIALAKVFGTHSDIVSIVKIAANRVAANPSGYTFKPVEYSVGPA